MEGSQIGSYRIERKLGAGGMGVVYVGVDTRLGRRAAIKQLLPELSGQREIVERFFNEAKAAASINHPGIVEIYDVGWHTDGSAYFAMKLLDGDSLAVRMRAGRLPLAHACAIARQVASALAAAHARGIVHRDLKPDNIIVVRDDEIATGDRAMVLDFGIAKLFGDQGMSAKTRTGSVMGTPTYMSPEQCRGAGEVDHRTDIYALGCILFEMLAGRTPFVGTGVGEILGMHQFVPAPTVRSLRGDVPAELEAIAMRCLEKDPASRYQTMTELAAALRAFAPRGASTEMPAPASAPVPTTMASPPATTLSAAPGQVTATRGSRRRSIVPIVLGGLVVTGVVIAIVAASVKSSSSKTASGQIASGSDRTSVADRAPAVVDPPGAAPADAAIAATPIDATSRDTTVTPTPVEDPATRQRELEQQATRYQVERKWDDLAKVGDQLNKPELVALANREKAASRALDEVRAAVDHGQNDRAAELARKIPKASVYKREATALLQRSHSNPPDPTAAPAVSGESAADLVDKGSQAVSAGQFAAALAYYEKAIAVKPDLKTYKLACMAACNARNAAKAKLYFAKLPSDVQPALSSICARNSIQVP